MVKVMNEKAITTRKEIKYYNHYELRWLDIVKKMYSKSLKQ